MSITTPIATVSDYITYTGETVDSDEDYAKIETALLAAQRQIERSCGTVFCLDAADAPTTRLYRAQGSRSSRYSLGIGGVPYGWAESENPYLYGGWSRLLSVQDIVTVTSIKIDTNLTGSFVDVDLLATTDYELWPNNAATGPEPKPYTSIYIPPYSTSFGFPALAQVQVIGRHGWPEVPEPIVRMCCELVALRRGLLNPSAAGVRSMGVYQGPSITYSDVGRGELPKDFLDQLRPYRRDASVL